MKAPRPAVKALLVKPARRMLAWVGLVRVGPDKVGAYRICDARGPFAVVVAADPRCRGKQRKHLRCSLTALQQRCCLFIHAPDTRTSPPARTAPRKMLTVC